MEKKSFDLEYFDLKLDTDYLGRNFIYAVEVDSTNNRLLNDRNSFNKNGTVLLSEFQTEGKGRNLRRWYSQPNQNLTFSILFTDRSILSSNLNLINLAASLSTAVSIENLYQLRTELKWPNDILIESEKAGGILFESISKGNKIERLVIGIGLNVNQSSFQGEFLVSPTSIKIETGQNAERERILAEILNNFENNLSFVKTSPQKILKEWKAKCKMIGENISISDGVSTKHGIFDDIDENGFLLLKTKSKIEKIQIGDVSLR